MGLQQFNIKLQYIQGKKNVVADVISTLRTLGLYQDKNDEDVPLTTEDVIKNIIEVYSADIVLKTLTYNVGKLNLDVLRKEQQQPNFARRSRKWRRRQTPTSYWIKIAF